jgi:signal transduction histidine kinase
VLGYVITKALAVQELLKGGQVERAESQVAQLGEAAHSAYADVREGILGLRTSLGPGRNLLDALREYLGLWHEQSNVDAELTVDPPEAALSRISPAAELQLLRIVQEALANVRKHAEASCVAVQVTVRPDAVEMVITDNGRGFRDVEDGRRGGPGGPHFGLTTMRERAESIGGSLHVDSTPGEGTRVVVSVPA